MHRIAIYSGRLCLQLKISADCDTLSVLYWDDDDDLIPINSQDELSEAFKVGNCNVHMTSLTFCSGETQTMSHIVESCPLTKLNGGLTRLHSADEDAVSWLTNYGK